MKFFVFVNTLIKETMVWLGCSCYPARLKSSEFMALVKVSIFIFSFSALTLYHSFLDDAVANPILHGSGNILFQP